MPPATDSQEMEIETVKAMFEDAVEMLSDDPPRYSVALAASSDDPPELRVTVTYPDESYPDAGSPVIELESISSRRRVPVSGLLKELQALAADLLGMPCVVAMLQRGQEFLVELVEEADRAALQRRGEAIAAAAAPVASDPTIRMGTGITRELFEEWRLKHLSEKMAVRAEIEKKTARESASKLTGRQLWDSTLRNADWELFGAADADGGVGLDDAGFAFEFGDDEEAFDLEDEGAAGAASSGP